MSLEAYSASLPPASSLKRHHSAYASGQDIPMTRTKSEEAMAKRVKQAAKDHNLVPSELPIGAPTRAVKKVYLNSQASSYIAGRIVNEDTHEMISTPYGEIFAICDGHGAFDRKKVREGKPQLGKEASQLVASSIREDLLKFIKECNFDTKRAFELWADKVQAKMPEVIAGSTAVVGFFERINHHFHVATVGDSEAIVFRMKDGVIHPIPMSPENNWATPDCVERIKQILEPEVFEKWEKLPTKERRYPPDEGVNLACSFGDRLMTYQDKVAVSYKPDCSLLQLQVGDVILIGCDGVFDFAGIDELIDKVIGPCWNDPKAYLAERIAMYVIQDKKSTDNVTVITVRVSSQIEIRASQASTEEEAPLWAALETNGA